jgi:hypothetical protein
LKVFLTVVDDLGVDLPWGHGHAWGVVHNGDLRDTLGCSDDTIGRRFAEAEAGGFLRRVPILSATGRVVGRVGFVWLRRPTDGPVATTAAEIAAAEAGLRAALEGRKGQPRTIPYPTGRPGTYRKTADAPTAKLRMHLPQNCGRCAPAPLMDPTCVGETQGIKPTTTTEVTTGSGAPPVIHAIEESSSSSSISIARKTPERDPEGPATAPASPPVEALLPAELVAAVDEAIPGTGREWIRNLLVECGRYGVELALLLIARLKLRLRRRGSPVHDPRAYVMGTLLGKGLMGLDGLRWKLDNEKTTLKEFRDEVHGEAGPRASPGLAPMVDPGVEEHRARCQAARSRPGASDDAASENAAALAAYRATRRPSS